MCKAYVCSKCTDRNNHKSINKQSSTLIRCKANSFLYCNFIPVFYIFFYKQLINKLQEQFVNKLYNMTIKNVSKNYIT